MHEFVKHIHFVGIGGIGMSGIAEVLFELGFNVSGSDLSNNPTVDRLRKAGATVHIGHAAENIVSADVVVTSSAVATNNVEVAAARSRKIPLVQRAEMLGELMRFRKELRLLALTVKQLPLAWYQLYLRLQVGIRHLWSVVW